MKKRALALLLALLMLSALLSACGESPADLGAQPAVQDTAPALREYTDDCGRTVSIPAQIKTVAVTGPLTQAYTLPLCLDMYVGFCSAYSEDAAKYIGTDVHRLPELGQLYGGKGTMDLEGLLVANPDVILDVGEAKGSIAEDFDALSEQTGIPFIHIDATVQTSPQAYRKLGELLGREEKAEQLARWCESTYADMEALMERVDAAGKRKTMAYLLGDKGLNSLAVGSFHAETVNMLSENVVDVGDVVSSGAGNEIDMEQLMLWDPEIIVFAVDSIYDQVWTEPSWQQLSAVKNGEVFETPYGPYGWLASPPAVQRYLGMIWLADLLYPDMVDYDLQEKVGEYYKVFYGYELSEGDYGELMAHALRK